METKNIEKAVEELATKAAASSSEVGAQHLSQSALNLAHVLATIANLGK